MGRSNNCTNSPDVRPQPFQTFTTPKLALLGRDHVGDSVLVLKRLGILGFEAQPNADAGSIHPLLARQRLVGVIDESDILLGMQEDASHFRMSVASAMTDQLQTLPPGASLAELRAELDRGLVAIIADASGFYGLITRVDMLIHLRRSLR